jgi:hypothetical protein
MIARSRSRTHPYELVASVVVVGVLATVPLWIQGWWTALPFAATLGGVVGGRWMRWFWSLPVGFAAGALAWGLELSLLPADPRTRLADVLAPAEGLSPTVFLVIGPILFGVVAAVTALAVAGAIRLAVDRPPDTPETVRAEPVEPGPSS